MASLYKRKNKNGTTVWRAVVRIKGYPKAHWKFCSQAQLATEMLSSLEKEFKALGIVQADEKPN